MDALQAILTRHSTRSFKKKEVAPELVRDLLRAAMQAPSAANEQPWHFVVIDDPDLLERIPAIHPYAAMAAEAPVAILVCGEPGREKHDGMWIQDCAAATENILLAAHGLGLGGVWVGVYPREERMAPLRKLLHIPEPVLPFALVPIGYPAGPNDSGENRFDEDRVRKNRWQR